MQEGQAEDGWRDHEGRGLEGHEELEEALSQLLAGLREGQLVVLEPLLLGQIGGPALPALHLDEVDGVGIPLVEHDADAVRGQRFGEGPGVRLHHGHHVEARIGGRGDAAEDGEVLHPAGELRLSAGQRAQQPGARQDEASQQHEEPESEPEVHEGKEHAQGADGEGMHEVEGEGLPEEVLQVGILEIVPGQIEEVVGQKIGEERHQDRPGLQSRGSRELLPSGQVVRDPRRAEAEEPVAQVSTERVRKLLSEGVVPPGADDEVTRRGDAGQQRAHRG